MKLRVTRQARNDFFDAFDRIATSDFQAALRWERDVLSAFRHIDEFPQSGRRDLELAPGSFRFWTVGRYLIVYNNSADPCEVLGLLHASQDLLPVLRNRLLHFDFEPDRDEATDA